MEMNEPNDKLDRIIDDSFRQSPDCFLSDSFTDNLVKRLEKQLLWKELLSEFGMKLALSAGSLAILLVCLIFPAQNDPRPWFEWIAQNRIIIAGLIGVGAFIVIFDQILLKFLFRRSQKSFP
jgi:hypothetical protein